MLTRILTGGKGLGWATGIKPINVTLVHVKVDVMGRIIWQSEMTFIVTQVIYLHYSEINAQAQRMGVWVIK